MFGLTILGNNSAIPAFDRHPTAQAITYEDQIYLIDCGEGTQIQLGRYKIRRSKIHHIFISHLHGDHYFGLIGLLTSMGLMNREHPLHLYGPPMLYEIVTMQLNAAGTHLPFPLEFHPITKAGIIHEGAKMQVSCFPVKHRIPCFGFLFKEKRLPRKLLLEVARAYQIPASFFHHLQLGEDYIDSTGNKISNDKVTIPNPKGRIYAYSADTIYDEGLAEFVAGANLLYHETTYLDEMRERAAQRYHTTTKQAAHLAKIAGVKSLLIGHFSSKYDCLQPFLSESTEVFPNTRLAIEGVTYRVL